MKKQLLLLLVAGFTLAGCEFNKSKTEPVKINYDENGYQMKELETEKVSVTFYYNYGKEESDLGSGMHASTFTTAFKTETIDINTKVSKPDTDPLRMNYEFDGWHLDQSENSPFDFDTNVIANLFLYAHWTQTGEEEEFIEPEYVAPSKIDDSIDTLVSITGVLNMPIEGGNVKLSTSGISRVVRSKDDATDILNYKIKSGVTLTATYNESTKVISYSATKNEEIQQGEILVKDNSANLKLDNGTYETKAANYEANSVDFEDHRIMLAGSSSMENWTNSTEDLKPLTTYNHGIGGTTVEQWKDKLNQRLVYPYSPKMVVYYVGVNNIINTGSTQEQTATWLTEMFDDVHEHLPDTHIYYVLINELPNYRNKQAQFDYVNNVAKAYEASHDYVTTLNAGQGLLKPNGEPNQAFFLLDGLHMSLCGYAIWGKFIKDKLIQDLKQNA